MWIERIELKVNRGSYLCWEELIQDVTLIVHNCYIANENHDGMHLIFFIFYTFNNVKIRLTAHGR